MAIAVLAASATLVGNASGQVFSDPILGVSFDPPSGWILKEFTYQDGGSVRYAGPEQRGAIIPSIEVSRFEHDLEIRDVAGLMSLVADGAGGEILRKGLETNNGIETYTLIHQYDAPGHPGVSEIDHYILFYVKDTLYSVTYANDQRFYQSHISIFEEFLRSLHLGGVSVYGDPKIQTPEPKRELNTKTWMCGSGTMLDRSSDQCVPTPTIESSGGKGGCLIATAAYGTELAPEVQNLREIRNKMYGTGLGVAMLTVNDFYYSFSPTVADWERKSPAFREAVRLAITPAMLSFTVLDHDDIGSDAGLIAYVAGVALLNLGMYAGIPAGIIITARRSLG